MVSYSTESDRVREFWMSEYFSTDTVISDANGIDSHFSRLGVDLDDPRGKAFLKFLSKMWWYWLQDLDVGQQPIRCGR